VRYPRLVFTLCGILLAVCAVAQDVPDDTMPVARLLCFVSESCPECTAVKEGVLAQLQETYGPQLQVRFLEIEDTENALMLFRLEDQFGVTAPETPILFLGERILSGQEQCEAELPDAVAETLVMGGCEFPTLEAETRPVTPVDQPMYLAYFYERGCTDCDLVERLLALVQEKHPRIEVRKYDIGQREIKLLNEAVCAARNVPDDKRLLTPSVALGDVVLVQDDITLNNIETVVNSRAPALSEPPWDVSKEALREAERNVVDRAVGFRIAVVAGAGLLDGLNPCAFATLIFFISYLTFIGRGGKAVLAVGGAFALSVFCTYLLVGLGFFEFLHAVERAVKAVAIGFYAVTAAAAFVLGGFSLRDFMLCRRGQLTEITLQLPRRLKFHIHRTISAKSRTSHFVLGAVAAGFIVSLLELACTGQVYLPTIALVAQTTGFRSRALPLLILYNAMFVVPLVVVFVVTYFGVSSKGLTTFFQRHAARVKLATACLFFAMGLFLVGEVLRTYII